MERVVALINKLQEQIDSQAPVAYLTATAELLVAELRQKNIPNTNNQVSVFTPLVLSPVINRIVINQPSNDAVQNTPLPATNTVPETAAIHTPINIIETAENEIPITDTTNVEATPTEETINADATHIIEKQEITIEEPTNISEEKIVFTLDITPEVEQEAAQIEIANTVPQEDKQEIVLRAENIEQVPTPIAAIEQQAEPIIEQVTDTIAAELTHVQEAQTVQSFLQSAFLFDEQFTTIPTLPIDNQPVEKEIYELQGVDVDTEESSVHDRLAASQTHIEVASKLQDSPLKDLRKGIGINDRYIFVNELFRGDEAMYERSIKTINNFSIFPEAEFWIKRELKVKLGWNTDSETVKLFDQLVKRRFS